jgi:hypothetical protein
MLVNADIRSHGRGTWARMRSALYFVFHSNSFYGTVTEIARAFLDGSR